MKFISVILFSLTTLLALPSWGEDDDRVQSFTTGWIVNDKLLTNKCFVTEWMSSDNFEEIAEHFGIEDEDDFSKNPGMYVGSPINSYETIDASWGEKVFFIMKIDDCTANNKTKIKKNGTVVDKDPEWETDVYYQLIHSYNPNACKRLAPNTNAKCLEAYLVLVGSQTGGSMGDDIEYGIYGLFDLPNVGLSIVPLKYFGGWKRIHRIEALDFIEETDDKEALPPCPKDVDPTLTVKACFGMHTYDPGGSYTGEFKFGTRHGDGTYVYDDGTIYEGEWSYGKSNGHGTLSVSDGSIYVGEFKNNSPSGHGSFTYPNGDKYVGDWKDGKWHGQGVNSLANGLEYEGDFENDEWHGHGKLIIPNGNEYIGDWKNGEMNGHGTFTYANGSKYIGGFKDNYQNGQGIFKFSNGEEAEGLWENNEMSILNGSWKTHMNGNLFEEGQYKMDAKVGHWKYYDNAGRLWTEGSYKNGKKDGIWTTYDTDGSISETAAWVDGKLE